MLSGAYIFVAVIYVAIALSFIGTTATLAYEFWDYGWLDLMATDSHLFVFFPTFGLVALVAFYLPSVAFVDHYWRDVALGKLRFIGGALALIVLSQFLAQKILQSPNHSVWEVAPQVLSQDVGAPANCVRRGNGDCERLPVLVAVNNLRLLSQNRLGLSEFVRNCDEDLLIAREATEGPNRYCAATTPYSTRPDLKSDDACCAAQERLVRAINTMHDAPNARSLTGTVHAFLLPLKIFFLMILVSISLLLTLRFKAIDRNYHNRMLSIEIGLIVGTIATLFFPLMAQAFLQSLAVLAGNAGQGTFSTMVPAMSVGFGIWTFLIIIFFFRRNGDSVELLTKIGSAAAGGIALMKYDVIVAFLVRAIGSGTTWFILAGLVIAAAVLSVVTLRLVFHRS